jgi:hypothetical protein
LEQRNAVKAITAAASAKAAVLFFASVDAGYGLARAAADRSVAVHFAGVIHQLIVGLQRTAIANADDHHPMLGVLPEDAESARRRLQAKFVLAGALAGLCCALLPNEPFADPDENLPGNRVPLRHLRAQPRLVASQADDGADPFRFGGGFGVSADLAPGEF